MSVIQIESATDGICECCGGEGLRNPRGERVQWEAQLNVCARCLFHLVRDPDRSDCPFVKG